MYILMITMHVDAERERSSMKYYYTPLHDWLAAFYHKRYIYLLFWYLSKKDDDDNAGDRESDAT